MRSLDMIGQEFEEARQSYIDSLSKNDVEAHARAAEMLAAVTAKQVFSDYEISAQEKFDGKILAQRGIRQLTGEEHQYYQKVITAMKSREPKQALTDLDVVMPVTVIDAVFEDLGQNHPLLSRIDFQNSNGLSEIIMNADTTQLATWGPLCGDVNKELQSSFEKISTTLYKLSAFLPVCKAMLDLGPTWLDNYVRRILREALACGLEYGLIMGDGYESPIGMIRQSGEGVTVTGGKYPEKASVVLDEITPASIGRLLSIMAMGPNGKTRNVDNVVFLVNGQDYYEKLMPATTMLTPGAGWRNDVMPYPMTVLTTSVLPRGKAIIGMAKKYFAPVGMNKEGRIEYSDEYRFLEDERVYLVKLYANGRPKDNNAFVVLDISNLQPATYKVTQVTAPAASSDATLAGLSLGAAALTPAFGAATTSYTATTTNASNVVSAIPADAMSTIKVTVNGKEINNGAAASWDEGENTVQVTVTAENGTATKTYTVKVTKS